MTAAAAFCTADSKPDRMGEKLLTAAESGVPEEA